jgi:hypothetical protein
MLDSHPTEDEGYSSWVPFGTSTWTYKEWDFVVPTTLYKDDVIGQTVSPSQQIRFVIPWMQVCPYEDNGVGYFADAVFKINP